MEAVAGEYMEEAVPWLAFWNALYPESRVGARVFCLGEKTEGGRGEVWCLRQKVDFGFGFELLKTRNYQGRDEEEDGDNNKWYWSQCSYRNMAQITLTIAFILITPRYASFLFSSHHLHQCR
jgi:hypothetical protein